MKTYNVMQVPDMCAPAPIYPAFLFLAAQLFNKISDGDLVLLPEENEKENTAKKTKFNIQTLNLQAKKASGRFQRVLYPCNGMKQCF